MFNNIVLLIILAAVVWQIVKKVRTGNGALGGGGSLFGGLNDCYSLLKRGVPARGILLKVGSQRNARGTAAPGYYELRSVTIDVEVPGKQPYTVDCMIAVPANLCRLILPGATLELRVDPSRQSNVAVYGPGVGLSSAGYP